MRFLILIFNAYKAQNFDVKIRKPVKSSGVLHDLKTNRLKKKAWFAQMDFVHCPVVDPSLGGAPKTTRLLVDLIRHQLRKIAALGGAAAESKLLFTAGWRFLSSLVRAAREPKLQHVFFSTQPSIQLSGRFLYIFIDDWTGRLALWLPAWLKNSHIVAEPPRRVWNGPWWGKDCRKSLAQRQFSRKQNAHGNERHVARTSRFIFDV